MYRSYVRAFHKFANSLINRVPEIRKILRFATLLTSKANELLQRAAKNNLKDLPKLQKELFETGRDYVTKFAALLRQREASKPKNTSRAFDEKDK